MTKFIARFALGMEVLCIVTSAEMLMVGGVFAFINMLSAIGIRVLGYFLLFIMCFAFAILIIVWIGASMEDNNEIEKQKEKESTKEI